MNENKLLKLNVGCGPKRLDGYVNIDIDPSWKPDLVCNIRCLPYEESTVDLIFASDILEHFGRLDVKVVLENWYKVLKPSGQLIIKTPNIDTIIDSYKVHQITVDELVRKLYGNQDSKNNYHYTGFSPASLKILLSSVGFRVYKITECLEGGDWSNMAVRCQK